MRLIGSLLVLFVLAGMAAAQDTNFPVGPQYLISSDSASALLHPIATPSLNLDAPLPPIASLPEVGEPVENQLYIPDPVVTKQADLLPIFYGYPRVPVVEIISPEATPELPTSITDAGVGGVIDPQSLRGVGFEIPLGDVASHWKAHIPHDLRVYTNADIQRLHPS